MKLLNLVIMVLVLTACGSSEKKQEEQGRMVTVRGKVNYPSPGLILITEMRQGAAADKLIQDTIQLKADGSFEKPLRIMEPGYFRIDFFQKQIVDVILDKTDIMVTVDGNSAGGAASVTGSPDLDLIEQVQTIMRDAQQTPELRPLEQEYQIAAQQNNQKRMEEIRAQYLGVIEKARLQVAAILKSQPPSLGLIHLLQNGNIFDDPDKYIDVYVTVSEKFKREWSDIQYGKDFVSFAEKLKVTAIGQPAPEISLPDPNGKIISLSSLRGKYVLVDFWAKWCGPCRRENPNVVKAYRAFKGKNFDILGVSLDRNREDWVRAIEEDGLTWNHVSDLKYFESKAALDYNINGIPFSILVDPSGVIIAKNLRGNELHRKLAEVLN